MPRSSVSRYERPRWGIIQQNMKWAERAGDWKSEKKEKKSTITNGRITVKALSHLQPESLMSPAEITQASSVTHTNLPSWCPALVNLVLWIPAVWLPCVRSSPQMAWYSENDRPSTTDPTPPLLSPRTCVYTHTQRKRERESRWNSVQNEHLPSSKYK